MPRQPVPSGLGKWSTVAKICPTCVPDDNNTIDLNACVACLTNYLQPIDHSCACQICCQEMYDTSCGNPSCHDSIRKYGRIYAIGYHQRQTLMRLLINPLKYSGYRANAIALAALLWKELRSERDRYLAYDYIAPVPKATDEEQTRGNPLGLVVGVNISFLRATGENDLADKFSLGDRQILRKDFRTERSPGMSLSTKQTTAYAIAHGSQPNPYSVISGDRVQQKDVLIIDDVFTSGYKTMIPISLALTTAGTNSVDGLVLSRRGWDY